MSENVNKRKIVEIDFIRAVCALSVLLSHYSSASKCKSMLFIRGSWGVSIVTVFFVISGMVLYLRYSQILSLKEYYLKRFKSIFPSFWIAYFILYLEGVFNSGDLFYHDQPWCLIFSIIGMDGYAQYKVPNYYYIGEWFLGAIIILYIIYPLLLKLFNKSIPLLTVILFALYAWFSKTYFHTIYLARNIVTCAISLCFGMLIMKYEELFFKKNLIVIIMCVVSAALALKFGPVPFITQMMGFAMTLVLFRIGKVAMKNSTILKVVTFLSSISYQFFLLQHQFIDRMLGYQNYTEYLPSLVILLITIALTIMFSWALKSLDKDVVGLFNKKKVDAN